jgi:ankyrin repeat protein
VRDVTVQDARPMSRFLRMAVVAGVESAVQMHIDRGDNLNARDEKGQTPLMLSAARNRPAICKMLLAAGADAGLLDPLGRDALSIAEAAGATEAASAIAAALGALVLPLTRLRIRLTMFRSSAAPNPNSTRTLPESKPRRWKLLQQEL